MLDKAFRPASSIIHLLVGQYQGNEGRVSGRALCSECAVKHDDRPQPESGQAPGFPAKSARLCEDHIAVIPLITSAPEERYEEQG